MSERADAPSLDRAAHLRRRGIALAAALGFLAVALGAFGAHALQNQLLAGIDDADARLAWWRTGVAYQMWHALLLLGACAAGDVLDARTLRRVLLLVLLGALLFSGSLYAMTLSGVRVLGAITPLGGLSFLAAWAQLGWCALDRGGYTKKGGGRSAFVRTRS